MPDGKILQAVTVRWHDLSVWQLLTQSYQSCSAADTTMVVTATLVVKVWLKNTPASQTEPKEALTAAAASPRTGISMSQLVAVLFLTIIVNLAITQYQTITRPWIAFVGSWMLNAIWPFKVCMNIKFREFNQLIVQKSINPVNLNTAVDSAPTFRLLKITPVDR